MIQSIRTVTFVLIEYEHTPTQLPTEYRVYPDGRVALSYGDEGHGGELNVFVSEGSITFIRELQAAAYPGVVFENKFL